MPKDKERYDEMMRRLASGERIGGYRGKPPKQMGPPDVSGMTDIIKRKKKKRSLRSRLLEEQ